MFCLPFFEASLCYLILYYLKNCLVQWKGINCKQSTRWQHISRLKASAFFSLQNFFSCYETPQLILGTGTAIWWVKEPHCLLQISTKLFLGGWRGADKLAATVSTTANIISNSTCMQLDATANTFNFSSPCAQATGICESKIGKLLLKICQF
jgi:hypothetical protein